MMPHDFLVAILGGSYQPPIHHLNQGPSSQPGASCCTTCLLGNVAELSVPHPSCSLPSPSEKRNTAGYLKVNLQDIFPSPVNTKCLVGQGSSLSFFRKKSGWRKSSISPQCSPSPWGIDNLFDTRLSCLWKCWLAALIDCSGSKNLWLCLLSPRSLMLKPKYQLRKPKEETTVSFFFRDNFHLKNFHFNNSFWKQFPQPL